MLKKDHHGEPDKVEQSIRHGDESSAERQYCIPHNDADPQAGPGSKEFRIAEQAYLDFMATLELFQESPPLQRGLFDD